MRFFLAILYFSISIPVWSQAELHIVNYYGFRDGLNTNYVFCLRQDSRGFLWLGTKEGLDRFDGFQFKKYFTEKDNPNSLSHNKVFDILEYQPGFILFATGSGLSVLNTKTGQFENEKIKFAPLKARSGTIVSSLYQDPEDRIWINHSGEIDVFDKNLNYLFRFTDLEWAQSLKGVKSLYESWYMDQKGRLWLPTDDSGLQIINFQAQEIYNRNNNPEHLPYLEYSYLRSFLLDEKNNTLWLAPWGEGLIKFDLQSGQIFHEYFNLSEPGEARTINSLLQTSHGSLLFTINGHCYEMDPHTMIYSEVSMPEGLSEKATQGHPSQIYSIAMIRYDDHHYWIGGTGLYQLDDIKTQNDLVVIPQGKSEECSDLMISGSGTIYTIYDNGWLVAVDKNMKNFTHYQVPLHPQSALTELCEDQSGQLWIGSTHGIQLFDPVSGSFHDASFLPAGLKMAYINVLFRDHDRDIWIGTRDPFQLFRYTSASGITQQIPQETIRQFSDAGKNGRISSITEDEQGRLWMVSMLGGGILCFEKKTDRWTSFPVGIRNHNFLVNKGIVSILPGEDGYLWLSTVFGDGLVCYHYSTDSIIQYTRENGLLSDYVQTIIADHADNLWLTSEFGVTQFSKNVSHSVSNIPFESDLFAYETFEAAYDVHTAHLVLAAHDRYIFISTLSDSAIASPPTPLLDRIDVNNKELFTDLNHPVLHLDHTQKNISIDFTAVHFLNAENLRFAYLLKGADDDWKYTTLNRNAQYAALAPGSYVFKLKVADESGNWGPDHEVLSFTIVPPFWKTAWFILCLIASVVLITFWIVRKRIRTIRYEAGLKQKIAETEMMALRAQMNPHFIFNCINSIDSLIQDNDKYHATIYLNKFAKLIRCILDSSKQNTVTLANDMETLKLYIEMEQFRNDNKFTADIKADPALLQEDFKVPPLIIQPYVENAILHGLRNRKDNDGQLSISLNRLNGKIQYIIEDNGVGRMHTQNGHSNNKVSYGMQMSSDRIRLFNQEENASVEITDLGNKGISSGTRVEVLLKII
ncbi:MAG: two-component regulator propeller domain-containing protein [Saprospiraceae bacterium]